MRIVVTEKKDLARVPWDSVFRCAQEYKANNPSLNDWHYEKYMLDNWGIDHGNEHFRIADEKKYMMFLLRWT